jgi:mannitol 2-dehydrogenase
MPIAILASHKYKKTLMERFSNQTINDQVTRICSEGSAKLPKWLLPSIAELLEQDGATNLLSLVVASWIYYLGQGVDESGKPLEIIDARAAELRRIAKSAWTDPRPMLAVKSIFGEKLPANQRFIQAVEVGMQMLAKAGAAATMRHYLSMSPMSAGN